MSSSIEPFDSTVPQSEVDRLFRKLKDTRLPKHEVVPDAGDQYGPPLWWVHKLYEYWTNKYDWSAAQKKIASWDHFVTNIEGLRIHFVHKRANKSAKKVVPLLLVHGWPGSFYEFSRVVDPLATPKDAEDVAFDVIVPSLPGYCWSEVEGHPKDWTLQDTARIFDTLMERLGYDEYCASGGDWGHWVVRELGARYSARCKAVHTNMCPSQPPVDKSEWTEREKIAQQMTDRWLGKPGHEWHMGYAVEMRTRPQTIGIAFSDNPVGIMMFVGEKYYELVDPKFHDLNDPEFVNDVLTTICLYYFTSPSIMTSMLCYTFNVRHEDYVEFNEKPENKIKAPFGFSSYRWDITPTSQRSAATTGNCQWFRQRDYGGHFIALEVPDDVVDDLRDCYTKLYKV